MPPRSVLKRAYKSLKVLGLSGWKLKKTDQSCEEAPKVMPVRRTFEVTETTSTTTQPPFMRIGTPSITTGQLTAKMLGRFTARTESFGSLDIAPSAGDGDREEGPE